MTDAAAPMTETPRGGGGVLPAELVAEGYVTRDGLVFRVRASGDLAAVVEKAGGHLVEIPVRLLSTAAGASVVEGIKAGLRQLSVPDFLARLPAPGDE